MYIGDDPDGGLRDCSPEMQDLVKDMRKVKKLMFKDFLKNPFLFILSVYRAIYFKIKYRGTLYIDSTDYECIVCSTGNQISCEPGAVNVYCEKHFSELQGGFVVGG